MVNEIPSLQAEPILPGSAPAKCGRLRTEDSSLTKNFGANPLTAVLEAATRRHSHLPPDINPSQVLDFQRGGVFYFGFWQQGAACFFGGR